MLTMAQRVAFHEILATLPGRAKVLDVGIGQGEFLATLGRAGYRIAGTDIAEAFIDQARARLRAYAPVLLVTDDPSNAGSQPSAVTCFEVLEHVPDPHAFLARMPRDVPTWFSVPNARRWWVRLTGIYEPWDFPPNHLRRFDAQALVDLLIDAGYRDVTVAEMPVSGAEVLEPVIRYLTYRLGMQRNTAAYDEVVSASAARSAAGRAVRVCARPITALVAAGLNLLGYKGGNLLAYGVKR